MSLELPEPGPGRKWEIRESTVGLINGHKDLPTGWDSEKRGPYEVDGFILVLNQGREFTIESYSPFGTSVRKRVDTEEEAEQYIRAQVSSRNIESLGPQLSVVSTSKVVRTGCFLGFGGTKEVKVFQEEKVAGWRFVEYSLICSDILPLGFSRDDVLKAANSILAKQRNRDHERALYEDSRRHVGFYPPKTLGEQFPNKA